MRYAGGQVPGQAAEEGSTSSVGRGLTRRTTDVGSLPLPGVWAARTRSPGRSLAATGIEIKKVPAAPAWAVVWRPAPSAHSSVMVAFGAKPDPPTPIC